MQNLEFLACFFYKVIEERILGGDQLTPLPPPPIPLPLVKEGLNSGSSGI